MKEIINDQLTGTAKKVDKVKRVIIFSMLYDELAIISSQYSVILENILNYINNYQRRDK